MYNRHKKIKRHKHKTKKVRYYKTLKYPRVGNDPNARIIRTQIGTRLDKLAEIFYGDSTLWWVIALANPENLQKDSIFTNPGLLIQIPSNIQEIKEAFELLNR